MSDEDKAVPLPQDLLDAVALVAVAWSDMYARPDQIHSLLLSLARGAFVAGKLHGLDDGYRAGLDALDRLHAKVAGARLA